MAGVQSGKLEELKKKLTQLALEGSYESFVPLARIYGVINEEIEKLKELKN